MTDLETAIMIKNMAREMVKRATAKNATQFKYGDKVTVDGKYEGVVQAVKDGYYEVRIFDGSRVVGTKVVWPNNITARNATAKNASNIKYKFKVGDKVFYTNSNGVKIGKKTITKLDERSGEPTYYIEPTDTPWFSVSESELRKI